MDIILAILLVIALFAIGASAYGSLSAIFGFIRAKIRLRDTSDERFETVLASNDISVFDGYLTEVIGEFSLQSYIASPTVSERVDQFIHRLRDFVGTESEVKQDLDRAADVPQIRPFEERFLELPPSLSEAAQDIYFGERWNGLARLRREIEIRLRDIAKTADLPLESPPSAGRLLRTLEARELINASAAMHLEYAIAVANKAVHGYDVGLAEAEGALAYAVTGFRILDSEASNPR